MNSARLIHGAAGVAAIALLAGCGSTTTKHVSSSSSLARAVYPRCGTEGFGAPQVRPLTPPGTKAQVWTVGYTRRQDPRHPAPPGATTAIAIVEYSPALPNNRLKGAPQVMIAGHLVTFQSPQTNKRIQSFAAQWKTTHARYTVIADGTDPRTIKRLIACLP